MRNRTDQNLIAYINTLAFLFFIRILRYKIIWTVHNVLPHETITINDLKIRQKLSRQAVVKIVHSNSTLQMMQRLGIDTMNCFVIPHGNFYDAYPNTIAKKDARLKLGIPVNAKVILFFGRVAVYKNIPYLLKAFSSLKDGDNTYLVIAGSSTIVSINHLLAKYKKQLKERLQIHNKFIKTNDVQLFFNAADFGVFPFSEITTSGSVLLSLSFGKPVIAPRTGALKELPDNVAYLYDPANPNALENTLRETLSDAGTLREKAAATRSYVKLLSWKDIAANTSALYEKLYEAKDV